MTFEESYYTLKYREAKLAYPDNFGLDVAFARWKAKPITATLDGYAEVVPFMEAVNPLVVQAYEDREICAETIGRWMWLADRLFTTLCTKYAGAVSEYPPFSLSDRTEILHKSGTRTSDSSGTADSSGTDQAFPDYVDPDKTAEAYSVAGSKSGTSSHTSGTVGSSDDETRSYTDLNKTQLWQSIMATRTSLVSTYIKEFNKLFLSTIGDEIILREW